MSKSHFATVLEHLGEDRELDRCFLTLGELDGNLTALQSCTVSIHLILICRDLDEIRGRVLVELDDQVFVSGLDLASERSVELLGGSSDRACDVRDLGAVLIALHYGLELDLGHEAVE